MTVSFLSHLLSVVELPNEELSHEVVRAFGSLYPWSLAVNSAIGPGAQLLAHEDSDMDVLSALVYSGNPAGLDAILASDIRDDRVLFQVMTNWDLSARDQIRLVEKPIVAYYARNLILNHNFVKEARVLACQWTNSLSALCVPLGNATDPPCPEVSRLSAEHNPPQHSANIERSKRLTNLEWLEITTLETAHYLLWWAGLNPVLLGELGDGSTPLSRTHWINFLTLVDSPANVPLKRIISTAKRLARNA